MIRDSPTSYVPIGTVPGVPFGTVGEKSAFCFRVRRFFWEGVEIARTLPTFVLEMDSLLFGNWKWKISMLKVCSKRTVIRG